MEEFEFSGDWSSTIQLHHFDTYYSKVFLENGVKLEKKVGNKIHLVFADEHGDFDPDPKIEQLNTINFLLKRDNQKAVIDSIINYLNKTIYPYYKKDIFLEEEYPQFYPSIGTLDDFQKHFKLNEISIYTLHKEDISYYCLYFNVKLLDSEHGLSIELHKDRCIDHGAGDGTDGYNLASELNLELNARDLMHQIIDNEKPVLHKPDPTYGVLKPWQVDANRRFAYNAYKNNADDLLIDFVKSEEKEITYFKHFYEMAKKDGREKLTSFFSKYPELN